mmetsp:Transcript_8780/g.23732  ORF Transcript_8780/g.23732 Transcript_8780/m.23732 type:complete len:508 (-) Transcript_8780:121-1644(-)
MGSGASAESNSNSGGGGANHKPASSSKHVDDYESAAAKRVSEIFSGPGYEKTWLTVERVKHRSNEDQTVELERVEIPALKESLHTVVSSTIQHAANSPIEDAFVVKETDEIVFGAVFDGHGGNAVSMKLMRECYDNFTENWKNKGMDIPDAMGKTLRDVDREVIENCRKNASRITQMTQKEFKSIFCGSTAVVCVIDKKKSLLYLANCGDSRAIMGVQGGLEDLPYMEAVELSTDHSVKTDSERRYVKDAHPDVEDLITEHWDEDTQEYTMRVKSCMFTRSIGDVHLKDVQCAKAFNSVLTGRFESMQIRPLPYTPYIRNLVDIRCHKITRDTKFAILACDGFFDEVSNDEAVAFVSRYVDKYGWRDDIAQRLLDLTLVKITKRLRETDPGLEIKTVADLTSIAPGYNGRRFLHDDVTIVVLYIFPKTGMVESSEATTITPKEGWQVVKKAVNFSKMINVEKLRWRLSKWASVLDDVIPLAGASEEGGEGGSAASAAAGGKGEEKAE